jgi:hypothetical protein
MASKSTQFTFCVYHGISCLKGSLLKLLVVPLTGNYMYIVPDSVSHIVHTLHVHKSKSKVREMHSSIIYIYWQSINLGMQYHN